MLIILLCRLVTYLFLTILAGRQGSTVSSPSVSLSLPEDEEREETEPRCSFCDAPFPNIDA